MSDMREDFEKRVTEIADDIKRISLSLEKLTHMMNGQNTEGRKSVGDVIVEIETAYKYTQALSGTTGLKSKSR